MTGQKLLNRVFNKLERKKNESGSAKRDMSTAGTRNRLKFTVKKSENQLDHLAGNFIKTPQTVRDGHSQPRSYGSIIVCLNRCFFMV